MMFLFSMGSYKLKILIVAAAAVRIIFLLLVVPPILRVAAFRIRRTNCDGMKTIDNQKVVGVSLDGLTRFSQRKSDRNNTPDRFGYRASSFDFISVYAFFIFV